MGFGEELIGEKVEIFTLEDGFLVKFVDEKFKHQASGAPNNIETRLTKLEQKFEQLTEIVNENQNGLVVIRTRDLRRVKATS